MINSLLGEPNHDNNTTAASIEVRTLWSSSETPLRSILGHFSEVVLFAHCQRRPEEHPKRWITQIDVFLENGIMNTLTPLSAPFCKIHIGMKRICKLYIQHLHYTLSHIPGRAVLQVTLFNRLWSCICWTFWIRDLHLGTFECLNTPHEAFMLSSTTGGTAGSKQACIPSGKQHDFHASLTTEGNIFEFTCWMSRKLILTCFVVVVVIKYIHPS